MNPPHEVRPDSFWGILVAGGRGLRFGGEVPKQFGFVRGRRLIHHTLEALQAFRNLEGLSLVVPGDLLDWTREEVLGHLPFQDRIHLIEGGRERADSVYEGLRVIPDTIESVFVHDAVRPCVAPELIHRLQEASRIHPAVIPGLRSADTIKEIDDRGRVVRTLDRNRLLLIQTPQVFRREILRDAFLRARSKMTMEHHTDCASLVEASGGVVVTVPGDPENLKVTTPRDYSLVEGWLERAIRGMDMPADERAMP